MSSLVICMPYLMTCLFRSLHPPFFNWSVFALVSCKGSGFSGSQCLLESKSLILMKSSLFFFFFYESCFLCAEKAFGQCKVITSYVFFYKFYNLSSYTQVCHPFRVDFFVCKDLSSVFFVFVLVFLTCRSSCLSTISERLFTIQLHWYLFQTSIDCNNKGLFLNFLLCFIHQYVCYASITLQLCSKFRKSPILFPKLFCPFQIVCISV